MLPKKLRFPLRNHPDFFATAKRVQSPHLLLFYQPSDEPVSRWAIIVKKTHGKAHERLKTKRFLREAIRALPSPLLTENTQFNLVVLTKGKPQDFATYVQELQQLTQQLA